MFANRKRWTPAWLLVVIVCVGVFAVMFKYGGEDKKEEPDTKKRKDSSVATEQPDMVGKGITVVVDAGHGGIDPGKVGVHDEKEKDINLSMAKKLEEKLTIQGYKVVMTRTEDKGMYSDGDSNKKMADMRARIALITETEPKLVVSIHQNSFTQTSSRGAQVFYYEKSQEGKILAQTLQETIKSVIGDDNKRQAKANTNYYMLLHTPCTMVIVECGFLSNPEEATLLSDDSYQDKMTEAICQGINNYVKSEDTNGQ